LAVAIAVPVVLWLAGVLFPTIMNAYVPWLMITDLTSLLIAIALGLVAGTAVVEIANLVPISFLLTIGGTFMRLGRRIWKGPK
ncbi:MAG: hypothetical protein ACFFD9_08120, partial [Candidatus Thorarchaeota archaeon]